MNLRSEMKTTWNDLIPSCLLSLVSRIVFSRIFGLPSFATMLPCSFMDFPLLCFLLLHVAVVYVKRFVRLFHVLVLDL